MRARTLTMACCLASGTLGLAIPPAALAAVSGDTWHGPASPAQPLQLVFPLKVDGLGLERFAQAVSDPRSPMYGRYQSIESLARRFGASAVARRRVLGYLRSHGARHPRIDATGLFADATLEVWQAERLFATQLIRLRTNRGARYIAPSSPVRIPRALAGPITDVVGLDTAPVVHRAGMAAYTPAGGATALAAQASSARPRTGTPSGCASGLATGGFTPNQYLTAYGYDTPHRNGFLGQGERAALVEIDGLVGGDVATFAQCFGLSVPPINQYLVGLSQPPAPRGEPALDVDMLAAGAPGLSSIDVYETGVDTASVLRSLSAPLQNPGRRPQVISVSLGTCEDILVHSVTKGTLITANYATAEAAASGVTMLASAGDNGSTGCVGPSGAPLYRLGVNYPASSPYVLAVGGTNLTLTPSNQIADQVVWNDGPPSFGAAGGGFSDTFERPGWQRIFIPPNVGVLQTSKGPLPFRAVPDVAMLADGLPGFAIYCSTGDCASSGSPWQAIGGTSASTPLLAGGIAIIDQALASRQRPGLGELAALLSLLANGYVFDPNTVRAYLFHDVTEGTNDISGYLPGSGGKTLGCCAAHPGYDEASGWGSVDIAHLGNLAYSAFPDAHVRIGLSLAPNQHPASSGRVVATVSCSAACTILPTVAVVVGHARPFFINGAPVTFPAGGSKRTILRFSGTQLGRLRAALRRHSHVTVTVAGQVFDPSYPISGVIPFKQVTRRLTL